MSKGTDNKSSLLCGVLDIIEKELNDDKEILLKLSKKDGNMLIEVVNKLWVVGTYNINPHYLFTNEQLANESFKRAIDIVQKDGIEEAELVVDFNNVIVNPSESEQVY